MIDDRITFYVDVMSMWKESTTLTACFHNGDLAAAIFNELKIILMRLY